MNIQFARPIIALVLFTVLAMKSSSAELTPELIAELKMVEDVRISADGKWVTYLQVDETGGDNGRASELWLAPVDGPIAPRRLLPAHNRVSAARWSRDGRLAVVLTSETAPRRSRLVLLDPQSGQTRVLIDDFNGSAVEWSPNGKMLGFIKSDTNSSTRKQAKTGPKVMGMNIAPDTSGSVAQFHVVDATTGEQRVMTSREYSVTDDYTWAPDSEGIAALARLATERGRAGVTVFSFREGVQPRALWRPGEQTIGLAWSPDGKTIAWCGREFAPDTGQLVLMNAEGKPNVRTVQRNFPGSLHNIVFRADGRLAFGALENLRVGIYSVAGDGSDLRADHPASSFAPGSLGVGSFTKFVIAFSADGSRVASMMSGPREPANVIAGRWRGELLRRTALNPAVASLALASVEEISWKAADGLEIHGFLVKPAGFDPRQKYPMVVEVHGGPRRSWWATCFLNNSHWAQWLAHHGYIVLMPNPRGSEGRGADFVRANRKDLGGGDWRDIMAGVNHVLGLGFVDSSRLAIAGWSYGGYLTARGITQPEGAIFKAAIVGAGITNLFTRGGAAGGWSENHWGDPQALWKQSEDFFHRSPIAQVKNVQAATLILHGDNDSKVPHTQALEFHAALEALGVPVEARIYPGEGHGIVRRAHRIDLLNSIARWLRTYVPANPPAASQ